MATLFERAVARFLSDHLPDRRVEAQHRLRRINEVDAGLHRHRAPAPRPDLVVFDGERPILVLDTKYRGHAVAFRIPEADR